MAARGSIVIVIWILALACLLQFAPSQAQRAGFVSIDCGGQAAAPYNDSNGIEWTTDQLYMPGVLGDNATLQQPSLVESWDLDSTVTTLRYFPASLPQTKFCYSLGPVMPGNPYLIRATIIYGNYDLLNKDTVKFALLLNADLWSAVALSQIEDPVLSYELQVPALTTEFSVCVARTGTDDPFINSLELRPLAVTMTSVIAAGQYPLNLVTRKNYGAKSSRTIRYSDDLYDRYWYADTTLPSISTTKDIQTGLGDTPPSSVLQTAFGNGSLNMDPYLYFKVGNGSVFLALFFAEIGGATLGERVFDVTVNGEPPYEFDILSFAEGHQPYCAVNFHSNKTLSDNNFVNVSLTATAAATVGPIVGGAEVLEFWPAPLTDTSNGVDVAALQNLTISLHNLSDWTGDPCLPTGMGYNWVSCTSTNAPRITVLSLSHRNLSGSLSPDMGLLTALEVILLDNNQIEGQIPDLGGLQKLQKLDLQNNNLQGPIPDSLAALPSLSELLLQGNNLSGPIPQGLLAKVRKSSLNFNYDGNPLLCATPNATCGGSPTPSSSARKLKSYVPVIIIIALVSLSAFGVAIIFCRRNKDKTTIFCLQRKDRRKTVHAVNINSQPSSGPAESSVSEDITAQTLSFTLQDVKAMTNDFHDQIGRGGFGDVFLGKVPGGAYVAVKVSSKHSTQGVREFVTEVNILSRVHHKNLVSLVGFCNKPPERMLIYEYISNRTLGEHLYGPYASQMSWRTRILAAIDAAQGLEYLHFGCQPTIIHRDVKSSNILLNDKMEAKVADFGLSKPKLEGHVSHITATYVMGTHGYLDPEYHATSLLTDKSDVYSFGVVLFELVSGRPALDIERERPSLTDWVRSFLNRGDLEGIVDPILGTNYNEDSMWKVTEVGLQSTNRIRNDRPDMSKVVLELKEALRMEDSQQCRKVAVDAAGDFTADDPYDSSNYDSSRYVPGSDLHPNSAASTSFKDSHNFVRLR